MRAELLPGIGGYKVERELGKGGMGCVYLCVDDALDRKVAIKVLHPDLLEQTEMRARFLREARALARVSSPNVVAVHAVGEDAVAGPFVVMELLEGEDLQQRVARTGRLPWRDAVRITRDAVHGLQAAAHAGIVHRDIKPANLFDVPVEGGGGRAKLTDFGLARQLEGGASVTQAGLVVGTPAYLAPEVARGTPASHQSDLYSLGATLFHLVAGHPPFTAESPLEVLAEAISKEPPRLSSRAPEIPPALDDLVARMLTKTPGERPQGWAVLDDELARIAADAAAPARTATPQPAAGGVQRTSIFGSLDDIPGDTAAPSHSDLPTMNMPLAAAPGSAALDAPPDSSARTGTLPDAQVSGVGGTASDATGPRIKTAALTVMMTDIAGYTERTSKVSREESARWLALHDALLQPVFRSFGGKVVKTLGDAFLVTFASPTDAVHCACAVQDRLWQYNQGKTHGAVKPEDAIHVRVALSTGEVRLHKGDIFGEPVNLAARIEAIARPGEVLLSDAVYATMNAAEVRLEPRGEQHLKGISRPVTLYAAVPDAPVPGADPLPPFGGRALARVKSGVVDRGWDGLVANAPQALARAQAAAGPVVDQAIGALGALGGLGKKVPVAAGVLAALVLVVVVVLGLGGDSRLKRIDAGEARAVIEEIEQIAPAERNGEDMLVLGHAQLKLDAKRKAFATWLAAAKKDAVDARAMRAALEALGEREDNGAVELLKAWPSGSADSELKSMLKGEAWWPRHHALEILDARKAIDDDDRTAVGLIDLTADSCGDRRTGLLLLKKHAKSQEALDAIQKLGGGLENLCMTLDVGAARDAVKKRMAE